jgi:alpha-ketoglutarate-dependent taurine dioxygenase
MSVALDEVVHDIDHSGLDANGWTLIRTSASTQIDLRKILLTIGARLGKPIPSRRNASKIIELRPTEAVNSRAHSLSGMYSIGAFPCHTDTAHWATPCRYVLLACVNPGLGNRETVLLDPRVVPMTTRQRELLRSTPFRVRNGKGSFFSTVLQKGRPFIRYDSGCMQPLSYNGALAFSYLDSQAWPDLVQRIKLVRGNLLIVDNWRILHGRGPAFCDDRSRTLLRLYVHKDHSPAVGRNHSPS